MRDKMVTLTFMVLTILLSGAKAVPVEITQQPPGTEPNIRQVAFAAQLSRYDVNVEGGSPMVFDVVVTNIGNGYDNNTGVFTAPASGNYTFNLQIMSDLSMGWINAAVIFNGRPLCKALAESGDFSVRFCTTNVQLNKGDRVQAQQFEGSTYVRGAWFVMFSGTMVSYDIN